MLYNTYALERMASEISKERIREAKRQSKWEYARKSLQVISKSRSAR